MLCLKHNRGCPLANGRRPRTHQGSDHSTQGLDYLRWKERQQICRQIVRLRWLMRRVDDGHVYPETLIRISGCSREKRCVNYNHMLWHPPLWICVEIPVPQAWPSIPRLDHPVTMASQLGFRSPTAPDPLTSVGALTRVAARASSFLFTQWL